MSKAPSKQLGNILGRLPPATAAAGEEGSEPNGPSLSYAPAPRAASSAPRLPPAAPPLPAADEREVPLQVLIPMRVRIQLDRMHAETRKPLRRLVLESLQAIGLEVTEEDLAGKRGQKKPAQA